MIKTVPTSQDVLDFLQGVEHPQRRQDSLELLDMFTDATGQPAVMWGPSIVGFGKYHYKYESGHEGNMCVAGFSPRKAALSIYIFEGTSDDPGESELATLGKFKKSKGCLYVTKLDDIDRAVLKRLIKDSYENTVRKWA